MAQSQENKEYRTFVRGLITDASPLTSPENSSISENNFDININGYRQRRLGIDREASAENYLSTDLPDSQVSTSAMSVHYWSGPGNVSTLDLILFQYGNVAIVIEANKTPMTVLDTVVFDGVDRTAVWQATVINGDMLVATGDFCIHRLVYDGGTISVEKHGLLVRDIWGVADEYEDTKTFSTIESGDVSDKRFYNLLNQGWANKIESENPNSGENDAMLKTWILETQKWPTNILNASGAYSVTPPKADADTIFPNPSDQISPKGHYILDWFYRGQSRRLASSGKSLTRNYEQSTWGDGISGSLKYILQNMTTETYTNLLNETEGTDFNTYDLDHPLGTGDFNTNGPTGQYLPYDGVPAYTSTGGVSCVTSYASRVFYSGFETPLNDTDSKSINMSGVVLYSQVVDVYDKIGKCYSEGDPTGNADSDLIDSDGGLIVIQNSGKIIKMQSMGDSLVIFATRGIWAINGADAPFSATNQTVTKIASTTCVSAESVVEADSNVFFWGESGIYRIGTDSSSLEIVLEKISERKIFSFYKDIPQISKKNVKGMYDEQKNAVRWLYNVDDDYDGSTYKNRYNKQLNLDVELGSFYPYSFDSLDQETNVSPFICCFFTPPGSNIVLGSSRLFSNGAALTSDGNELFTSVFTPAPNAASTKYICLQGNPTSLNSGFRISLCELNNEAFVDWKKFDADDEGIDASAYMQTGYEILGDTQRKKQVSYLTMHFERTESGFESEYDDGETVVGFTANEGSSCMVSAYWDFADSTTSGKISTPFQAYRLSRFYLPTGTSDGFDYGRNVITTKNKIRGRGIALSLRITTEPKKACTPYGWGILFAGNTEP